MICTATMTLTSDVQSPEDEELFKFFLAMLVDFIQCFSTYEATYVIHTRDETQQVH